MSSERLVAPVEDRQGNGARIAAALIVLGAFLGLAAWTWHAHGDILIDTGRELYVPWRITEGEVLCRDIAHFSGPFSQYFNALCLGAFGNQVRTLECVNLMLLLLTVAVAHSLVRRAAGRFAATIASLVQLVVFSFAQVNGYGIFDWVLPYCHEITHGVALALAALWFLAKWDEAGGKWRLAVLGGIVGATFLTKPEPMIALAVALAVGLPLAARRRRESLAGSGLLVLACALVLPLLATAAFTTAMPFWSAVHATLGAWPYLANDEVRSLAFYRAIFGSNAPAKNLGEALYWVVAASVLFGIAAASDRLVGARLGKPRWVAILGTVGCVVGLFAVAVVFECDVLNSFRPLPLYLVLVGAFALPQAWRGDAGSIVTVSLCAFGAPLLGKMLLSVRIDHYGFALAMPGGLVVVAALTQWAPAWIRRLGGSGVVLRGTGLTVLLLLASEVAALTWHSMSVRSVEIGRGRDVITADPVRGAALKQALVEFSRRLPHEATLAVLPEGVSVNWQLRMRNPTGFLNFMPPEVILFGEDKMLAAFTASPPDYVLLVHKATGEYGLPLFGKDYGRGIMAFVHKRYRQVWKLGFEPLQKWDEFGIELLVRQL